MDNIEIILVAISIVLGSAIFGLILSGFFFGKLGKLITGYINIALHIALFVTLFFLGCELSVILLVFMASSLVYFIREYIVYKRGEKE